MVSRTRKTLLRRGLLGVRLPGAVAVTPGDLLPLAAELPLLVAAEVDVLFLALGPGEVQRLAGPSPEHRDVLAVEDQLAGQMFLRVVLKGEVVGPDHGGLARG